MKTSEENLIIPLGLYFPEEVIFNKELVKRHSFCLPEKVERTLQFLKKKSRKNK